MSEPISLSRRVLALALAATALVAPLGASAQDAWPTKPVRLVLPFPPGGVTDLLARALAEKLSPRLGQPVIVDNKPGAGTVLASDLVARAPADGHTLLMATSSLGTAPLIYDKVDYDAIKSFTPITQVASVVHVLVVNPSMPVQSVKDLVAYAKANPGKLNYASSGSGSTTHLAGELLKFTAGLDIVHIPYKGGPPAYADLMAGQVDLMFQGLATAMPQIQEKKLKVIAVGSEKRHPALPDVPTMNEVLAGFVSVSWSGLVASPKTPPAVANKIHAAISEALKRPEAARDIKGLDVRDLIISTPAEAVRFTREEKARWGGVIRSTGTTAD